MMRVLVFLMFLAWSEVSLIPWVDGLIDRHHHCTIKFNMDTCTEAVIQLKEQRMTRNLRWEDILQ